MTQLNETLKKLLIEQRTVVDAYEATGEDLQSFIQALGYTDLNQFFKDNKGAKDGVVDYIGRMIDEQQRAEWGKKLGIQL